MNLFWLFLILRIAKNYVLNAVKKDERSDNEGEEEDGPEEETGAVTALEDKGAAKQEVKRRIEEKTGMETDKPAVLSNGKLISWEARPEGVVERRKKR